MISSILKYCLFSYLKCVELVLKVRVQNPKESDFIEIELDRQELTYQDLLRVSCCELGVNPEQVEKIRKLPNTLVRKVRGNILFKLLRNYFGHSVCSSGNNKRKKILSLLQGMDKCQGMDICVGYMYLDKLYSASNLISQNICLHLSDRI